jgi:intracellular septation protein
MTDLHPSSPLSTGSQRKKAVRSLLLAGLLPVIAYTLVEEYFGTLWGLVAGMTLGVGEILSEWRTQGRVETITWSGNGLILGKGLISLFTGDGLWFKLQPAMIEVATAIFLMGSVLLKKPFMALMAAKQGMLDPLPPEIRPLMVKSFTGLTFRIGIFFLAHSILATFAAIYWSTSSWALLKGIGFTVSMFVYMAVEIFLLRLHIKKAASAL